MTIDPAYPERYRLRNGSEVVRIIPTPEHYMASCKLLVLYRDGEGDVAGFWASESGKADGADLKSYFDLIPHDPVLYYANVYCHGVGPMYETLAECIDRPRGMVLACIAVHASGKVRQIPLDATTDPEA